MFQKQDYWKFLAWTKTFQQHDRQKLVEGWYPSVLTFLIRKLQDLIYSYSKKIIETVIFLNSYIHYIKNSAGSKLFHKDKRQKKVHGGARLVVLFLIQKLLELKSSCSKLFKRFFFLKCYTTLSLSTTTILDIF